MDTFSSLSVNGQILPVWQSQVTQPGNALGPTYNSYGSKYPSTIPEGAGGNGNSAAQAAQAAPLSLFLSPVPVLIGMLVIGVLGLRYIHWRK